MSILKQPCKECRGLIITPTRELASQIHRELKKLTVGKPFKICMLSKATNVSTRSNPFDILISTPLRLVYSLKEGHLNLEKVQYLVLDEADRMLDMGFSDDLSKIFTFLPTVRQNLLFSATMPSKMRVLAKKLLHNFNRLNFFFVRKK